MTPNANSRRAGWVLVSSLLFAYLLVATRWQGISFYDDSMYMYFGQQFRFSDFVHNLSNAPLYALWFKLLSLVVHDAIWRYMASWALLVVAVTTLPLWMKLRRGWLYAVILLAIPFFSTATYISFFAAVFLLAGIGLLLRHRVSTSGALTLACCVCFVVAYARPEFEYGVILSAIAAIISLAYDLLRPGSSSERSRTLLAMMGVLLLTGTVLFTKTHSSSVRSGWAFLQHYNYRAWEDGRLTEDPWSSFYAASVFHLHDRVPDIVSATIGDYFHSNPGLFLQHLLRNLRDLRTIFLILATLLLVLWPWLSSRATELRAASLYLFFVSFPVLASSVIIYPRPHYAVIIFPTLLVFSLQLVPAGLVVRLPSRPWPVFVAATLLILFEARQYNHHRRDFDAVVHSNIPTVRCMQALLQEYPGRDRTIYTTLFDPAATDVYFDRPLSRIDSGPMPDWTSFRDAIRRTHPSWIATGPERPAIYRLSSAEFSSKLSAELGYQPHPCPPSSGVTIYSAP